MVDFERQEAAQRRAVQDHVALVHVAVVDGLATIGRWRKRRRLGGDAPEVSWWSKLGPLNRVERIVARELVSDRVTFECSTLGPKEWEARLSPFASGGRA